MFPSFPLVSNSLGLAIGSGLLYDSGTRLYAAGPASLFLGYVFGGTVLAAVLVDSLHTF